MQVHFRAEHYLEAARERIFSAVRLYELSRYSAAIYLAGVAVECILRAYILRKTKDFESRHDLSDLMRKSSIADFIPPKQNREFGMYLTTVWRRWKNNYRYASISRLSSEFRDIGLCTGIKGDPLKENARITLSASEKIINAGVLAWNLKEK
jgi:HEPN domain-containing protein